MPREVKAYKCRWCDAVMMDREAAEQAESTCPHNPALECCENCEHMQVARTPRFCNMMLPVKVCANPPSEDAVFNAPHDLGWCPNYSRNQMMRGNNANGNE